MSLSFHISPSQIIKTEKQLYFKYMNKYFKNENAITVDSLLKTYTDFYWGIHPSFTSRKEKFQSLVSQCSQSDQYRNYHKELNQALQLYSQLKKDIEEIEANKEEIIIKNSEEEYHETLQNVREQYRKALQAYNLKKNRPPKSKHDILDPIYKQIKKAERHADEEYRRQREEARDRCSCGGYYCQC